MRNQYFRFKQFTIEQEHCAMKVTTDACIQGAWTPVKPEVKRVLDIGAGTGLLSLMLAQRHPGIITDAIECDSDAARQARDNVNRSPWKDRINVIEADARGYRASHKYDLIISNPPFFSNSLLSDEIKKNIARHTISFTAADFLKALELNLEESGYAALLLPYTEYLLWKDLFEDRGWFEFSKLFIKHRPDATVKRVVTLFGKQEVAPAAEHTLIIQDNDNYTASFINLLSPFYLNL